jgi:hypothetical protein
LYKITKKNKMRKLASIQKIKALAPIEGADGKNYYEC